MSATSWAPVPAPVLPLVSHAASPAVGPIPGLDPSLLMDEELSVADAEALLFDQTHERRVARDRAQQEATNTDKTYRRHVQNYLEHWERRQDEEQQRNPAWPRVPAMPINATKVAIFIEYEMTREKRKRKGTDGYEFHTGTSLSVRSILVAVSALEKER
ncbi:hypothetical protein AURDEDRAFT_130288, partial [Auricularia subglabra TFB-10046 SS5]